MDNIFFDINYNGLQSVLLKAVAFLLVSILLIWLIYFSLSKLLLRKTKQRKEISLRLVFLWSLFVYFILFNVYLFVLFFKTGSDSLDARQSNFYLGCLPQLAIYLFLIVTFFLYRQSLKKEVSSHSLN